MNGEGTSLIRIVTHALVLIGASLIEPHTSVVNGEFRIIIAMPVCTSTSYSGFLRLVPMLQVGILVLRILTSHSQYATGSMHVYTDRDGNAGYTVEKSVREAPLLRTRRDA